MLPLIDGSTTSTRATQSQKFNRLPMRVIDVATQRVPSVSWVNHGDLIVSILHLSADEHNISLPRLTI
jgi:hypothetical protein